MKRQFSGLPIASQQYWIERYKANFPDCIIIPPDNITGYWCLTNIPSSPETRDILATLDAECHQEWLNWNSSILQNHDL
jgi:hypothetical protein